MGLIMIFRFFLVAAVVTAQTIDPTSKKDFKLKLDKYQAATGIDDAKKDEIWTKTIKNILNPESRNSNEKVKARYGISTDLGGTISPVILDAEFFNQGMMYQTGVFIIMDPGYYRLTVQCYHNQSGNDFSKYAQLTVEIDSQPAVSTYCKWADNGSASGIFFLEAFDTVFLEKRHERLAGGAYWNNFMIEKMPHWQQL